MLKYVVITIVEGKVLWERTDASCPEEAVEKTFANEDSTIYVFEVQNFHACQYQPRKLIRLETVW